MSKTATAFFEALMMDTELSRAVELDFGIIDDKFIMHRDLHFLYQMKVRTGEITEDDLSECVGDGPRLSNLLGTEVRTMYDVLPPEVNDEGMEVNCNDQS